MREGGGWRERRCGEGGESERQSKRERERERGRERERKKRKGGRRRGVKGCSVCFGLSMQEVWFVWSQVCR